MSGLLLLLRHRKSYPSAVNTDVATELTPLQRHSYDSTWRSPNLDSGDFSKQWYNPAVSSQEVPQPHQVVTDRSLHAHDTGVSGHMDQMESQLLSWHVPVDRLSVVHITFCPSTFRIWCDDILVENVQVEISHATPTQTTKESKSSLHQGFLCLRFPVQPINKPLTLKAAFTSKMDMRNVVNTGSPNFLTKLSHLTSSLGVKVTGWRIDNH